MALDLDIDRIRQLVDEGVRAKVYPGAVWAVGDRTNMVIGTPGLMEPDRPGEPMRHDTVFDVAGLTKILAVWPAIGSLVEDGKLHLDEQLGAFWSEVSGRPLGRVTARHLLTHTAGVPSRTNLAHLYGTDPQDIRDGVLHEATLRSPGEAVEHTDRAALVLGYLAEHLSGQTLDVLAATGAWQPLGMTRTRYGPLSADAAARCAPTGRDDVTGARLRGTAHDSSARLLGVCGIAGVFTVLPDLAAFLRHVLRPAREDGPTGLGPAWVEQSLRIQTGDLAPARGLFWHPAPGTDPAADGVWAHYGRTGTGVWLSPGHGRWAVLLTNRDYFTRGREPLTHVRDAFRSLAFSRG
ncbi:esterase [Streptomyces lucensis JCM 4490]|uniref:Esterase n=1 Tax=Streptomyces lucensis JCM 4490 TaxID=1306176 RepID=A0A918J716_9ACTN|nr:serine hydrolase domain-containing protein [Streptomyces lucensis]GGW53428.1 esterase [Streptomyces lucensis JCM 4490]